MSYYAKVFFVAVWALLVTGLGNIAWGSVVLSGTRVIYPAQKKEVTVTVTNQNKNPVLIQSWIENNTNDASASKNVPFVLTPPINRVDAGKAQTLRISFLGSPAVPQDRESVFWLNVLEVPAKSQETEDKSRLNIAFRNRIKMFYRPDNIAGNPSEAAENLRWEMKKDGLTAINTSKYYVSILSVEYKVGSKTQFIRGKMIAPGGSEFHKFEGGSAASLSQVSYTAINDYGGHTKYKAKS